MGLSIKYMKRKQYFLFEFQNNISFLIIEKSRYMKKKNIK